MGQHADGIPEAGPIMVNKEEANNCTAEDLE